MSAPIPLAALVEAEQLLMEASRLLVEHHFPLSTRLAKASGTLQFYVYEAMRNIDVEVKA